MVHGAAAVRARVQRDLAHADGAGGDQLGQHAGDRPLEVGVFRVEEGVVADAREVERGGDLGPEAGHHLLDVDAEGFRLGQDVVGMDVQAGQGEDAVTASPRRPGGDVRRQIGPGQVANV